MSKTNPELKKIPTFIEFVGMPSSGKTTLSHRAAEILRDEGIRVQEPTYTINNEIGTIQRYLIKLWYSMKLAWLRPAWALDWVFLVVRSRQKALKDFMLMSINCFFILEIYRHYGQRNDICFLDQGICQALLSLSYNSKTEDFIKRHLATVLCLLSPLDFRIIHIKTDVDTIIQRLKKRHKKQSRLELIADTTEFGRIIRGEKRKIEYLLKMLCTEQQADVITIQINGCENIHPAAQRIADLFSDSRREK